MRSAPSPVVRLIMSGMIVLAVVAATIATVRLLRPRQDLAVLGDSMAAAAKSDLVSAGHDAGFSVSVDAFPGVELAERTDAVAALAHHRSGPVVIELGTNDVGHATSEELAARIDRTAAVLADDPCVVFVEVGILFDPDGAAHAFNEHLRQVVAAHPTMHVYGWEAVYHQHTDWSLDSVHLRPEFVSRYAHGIIDTVHDDC